MTTAKETTKKELEAIRQAAIAKAKQDTHFTEKELAWLESIGAMPSGKDVWNVDNGELFVSMSVYIKHDKKIYTCTYHNCGGYFMQKQGDNLIGTFKKVVAVYKKELKTAQERFDKATKFAEQYK